MSQWPLPPSPSWNETPTTQHPLQLSPTLEPVIHRRPRNRPLLHLGLGLVTIITTTWVGSWHYAGFMADFVADVPSISFLNGLWYSLTILAILGTHEMGHYIACRIYGIDASLPYFLPAPPFILTGTFGAVIRIRQRITTKRMLFDIGAAGPIAGFVVVLPALFLGLWFSRLIPLPDDFVGFSLGEPLLFQFMAWLVWGAAPEGYTLNLHPVGLAAWFGLLVTAFNLFPIAQLDGGHISYATLGHRSTVVTKVATAVVVALSILVSMSWMVWAILMLIMLFAFGSEHPRTDDEHIPLDQTRRWIAIGTAIIFIVSFTPAPIEVMDLIVTSE